MQASSGEEPPASIEPYSKNPSEELPFAVCPPPTKVRASCMAAEVPVEDGEAVVGPQLQGSGIFGGFSPADLRSAYGMPSKGGAGLTVAITIAYDDPNAESDLATYRSQYGLSSCTTANGCFKKVNQLGEAKNYPKADSGWALETSLDLDMVSAICPECHILLVEANSNELEDLGVAVEKAATLGANVVSDSWAAEEFSGETTEDHYFNHPGTPVLFASGDWGYGVYYPAASPDVVSVGGTSLTKDASKRGWHEAAWSGAGSGCSSYEKKPAWQKDAGCAKRSVADVSAVSDPSTPVSVYDSYKESGWVLLGGTSVATPIMAGVEALSSSAFRIAGPSAFARAGNGGQLFDVTEGENGACGTESKGGVDAAYLCQADVGYDGPTGWGSPNGPQSLPVVITEAATTVAANEAILRGSVDPRGLPTEYRFEYGETTAYGSSVPIPDASAGSGSGYVEVSQAIGGLKGQTPYHYRIVAKNTAGTFYGVDRSFGTTLPTVTTGSAGEILTSGATLHATVDPEGLDTSYYFEYGSSTSYGLKMPVRATGIGSGTKGVEVATAIGGLVGGETYHYRVTAKNVAGVVHGKDKTFITAPAQWIADTPPQPANSGNGYRFDGISCAQANQCVAVGWNWNLEVHTKATLAELWNGKSWSVLPTPNPPGLSEGWAHEWYAVFQGVSCASASDCIAVGRYRNSPEEVAKPLAEHWDGSKWSLIPAVAPSGATASGFEGASCTTPTACTAVGWSEDGSGNMQVLAERWDGSKWSIQSTPNPGGSTLNRLASISCSSATICTTVGWSGGFTQTRKPFAERWDGSAWGIQSTPTPSNPSGGVSEAGLEGVSCTSPSECTAVGIVRKGPTFVTLAERWDGSQWTAQSTPTPYEEGELHSVSCTSSNACTAAGTYYNSSWRPLIERWNGTGWSVLEIVTPSAPAGYWHENGLSSISCANACNAAGHGIGGPTGSLAPETAFAEHEIWLALTASFSIGPASPVAGQSVSFDASSSEDPDGPIKSYSWDFGDGSEATGATPSHTYAHAGEYTVTLTVTDNEGNTAKASRQVKVANAPPVASFLVSTPTPTAAQPVAFDGSASSDPDGTIASYDWNFGDGSEGSGATPSHIYAHGGEYTVTLTVTDDEGKTAKASHPVVVTGTPPTASFLVSTTSPTATQPVSFDGSASSDPDGPIKSYSWDFGDGSEATGATPSHTYAHAGEYTVTLTVTDNEGKTAKVSHPVNVAHAPPVASFLVTTPTPTVTQPIAFDGSASSDPDGTIASYDWNFGDGSEGSGATPSHIYAQVGTYTVTLAVTDGEGETTKVSHPVHVANAWRLAVSKSGTGAGTVTGKPYAVRCAVACISAKASLHEGVKVTLAATPTSGSVFTGWSNCEVVEGNICKVTMGGARSVTAQFTGVPKAIANSKTLTFEKATGTGTGTVKARGLTCEVACVATEVAYKPAALVTLTATPASGSVFTGWSNCEVVEGSVCKVTMSEARAVMAQFSALPEKALALTKSGTGAGTVTGKPYAVRCAMACISAKASLYEGGKITLTATPASGSVFAGWSGCEVVEGKVCIVAMTQTRSVTAQFTGTPKLIANSKTLTFEKATGTGAGTVKASGLACEAACVATEVAYKPTALVTLTVTPGIGSVFAGWSGCEIVEGSVCRVTMSKAQSVTAKFDS
jgi:PKD repeat protein